VKISDTLMPLIVSKSLKNPNIDTFEAKSVSRISKKFGLTL